MASAESQEALSARRRVLIAAYATTLTLAFNHYDPAIVTTGQGCCACLRLGILASLVQKTAMNLPL
jgi:hypothetical protein